MKRLLGFAMSLCATIAPAAAQTYPEHSRRLDEEGNVTVAYRFGSDGRISSCRVAKSSGFPRLDNASCKLLRTRTVPPKDRRLDSEIESVITWKLPRNAATQLEAVSGRFPVRLPSESGGIHTASEGELPPGRRVNLGLYITVDADGSVESCKVRWGSGSSKLDKKACEIAFGWRYTPAKKNGLPIRSMTPETFFWAAADLPISITDKD